jgi:hypothetical protein
VILSCTAFPFHLFLNLSLSHTLSISYWSFAKTIQESKKAANAVPQLSSHPKPGRPGGKSPDYINFWAALQFCLWIFVIWAKILTWYSCLILYLCFHFGLNWFTSQWISICFNQLIMCHWGMKQLFVRSDPLPTADIPVLKLEFDCFSVLILYSYINCFHSALGSMVWSIGKSLFLINKTRKNKETNDVGKLIRKKANYIVF